MNLVYNFFFLIFINYHKLIENIVKGLFEHAKIYLDKLAAPISPI
jgi:hypothetical protein